MQPVQFNIYPNINITKKLVRAEINIVRLVLFERVQLAVVLFDEENIPHKSYNLQLDQTNGYNDWQNDKWLVEWVKKQISL